MLRRPHYIALAVVVLLTLVILNLPDRTTARLKLGIGSLFLPLFGLAHTGQQAAGRAEDALTTRSELLRENEVLRRDNQQLRVQLNEKEKLARENARLRSLFGWQQQKPLKLKLANVVLREPANWWRTIQIDIGSREGVSNNLPVLTTDGFLAGRVASASFTRSQVVLLGDPNCKVAARVENESRDTGIIGGARPLETELVEMGYLSRNANVKPGQDVKTSGLGGIFPKDIPIGKVVDSHPEEYGLNTVARVKLGANLSALEEVWVRFE
jgi:rod shape-determining protein MreC